MIRHFRELDVDKPAVKATAMQASMEVFEWTMRDMREAEANYA